MIEPDTRSVEEVEAMVENVREKATEQASQDGKEFIEKMCDSGNRVIQNPFGEPVVEIVAPVEMKEEIEDLIDTWDINPRGHGVLAQAPSFGDERPEISSQLVAWQFLLQDDGGKELKSCGFDLETILEELDDEPVMATTAPTVRGSLPLE
jgi:hypothetical protein